MLTLFAIPKPFRGHVGLIQRNAILSWMQLQPRPEIILLGDDEGTAEIAQELNLKHVPDIARNDQGTPLLNSLFELAQAQGNGPLYCYVNADIVLLPDFMTAIQGVRFERFMMTGQRWNLDMTERLMFEPGWERPLRDRITQTGQLEGPQAMDYFIFTRDTYTDIPPFAIGRLCWDNWMLYNALRLGIPLIDATPAITAVHQNHDYNHHPQGREGVFLGIEAQRNLQLLGGEHHTYFMLDLASWVMTPQGLQRPAWTWERLDRYLDMIPLARPHLRPVARRLLALIRQRHHLRTLLTRVTRLPAKLLYKMKGA